MREILKIKEVEPYVTVAIFDSCLILSKINCGSFYFGFWSKTLIRNDTLVVDPHIPAYLHLYNTNIFALIMNDKLRAWLSLLFSQYFRSPGNVISSLLPCTRFITISFRISAK